MNQRTVWFPTYAQALSYTKSQATQSQDALLGLETTTPLSWLEDKWGLWGTGEALVTTSQRILLVSSLLKNYRELVVSENTAVLIARFLGQVVGIPAFKKAQLNPPDSLSKAEHAVLKLASEYEEALKQFGMIEQGTALFALPDYVFKGSFSFGTFCNLPVCFQAALAHHGIAISMPHTPIEKLAPGVEAKFMFSAGKSVQNRLIFDAALKAIKSPEGSSSSKGNNNVLIIHPKPLAFYNASATQFANENISVAVRSTKSFTDTDFGKGFLALFEFLINELAPSSLLVDFMLSCVSGISRKRALELDAKWRADRTTSGIDQLNSVRSESSSLDYLLELYQDPDASIILGAIEDQLNANYSTQQVFLQEQLSALNGLRGLYNIARAFGMEPEEFLIFSKRLTVPVRFATNNEQPQVVITSLKEAAGFEAGSFGTVIACSLDSNTFKASEEHSATVTLMRKLGIENATSKLATLRHQFGSIQKCARNAFICERATHIEGTEVYPAFFWDEYISLYRTDEKDKHTHDLPEALCKNITDKGEEDLLQNLILKENIPTASEAVANPYNVNAVKDLLTYQKTADGKEYPVLSPSAMESYMNCPYRWFIDRKMGTQSLDEGFSALEKGNFAHAVFEDFYKQAPEVLSKKRPTTDTLPAAVQLLDSIIDELIETQPTLKPLSGRLVPVGPIEEAEVETLRKALITCLKNQMKFPEEFVPEYHEFVINKRSDNQDQPGNFLDENPVVYAGALLNGRVDRIDFSQDGELLSVIDYKGSISGHQAGLKESDYDPDAEFIPPHKVQALIYAKALQSVFPDKKPVSALYLSYNAKQNKPFLAGSYSEGAYQTEDLTTKGSCVEINFQAFLAMIENYLEKRVQELLAGNIMPNPLCKDSCKYCPVTNCGRRAE